MVPLCHYDALVLHRPPPWPPSVRLVLGSLWELPILPGPTSCRAGTDNGGDGHGTGPKGQRKPRHCRCTTCYATLNNRHSPEWNGTGHANIAPAVPRATNFHDKWGS